MFYLSSDKYFFVTKGEGGSLCLPLYVNGIQFLPMDDQTFRFKITDPVKDEVVFEKDFKDELELTSEDTSNIPKGFYVYSISVCADSSETFVLENLPFVLS